jgi:phage-related minor tail protein
MSTIGNYTKGKLDQFISLRSGFTDGASNVDTLQVSGAIAGMVHINPNTITAKAMIPDSHNGLLYGPITIQGAGELHIGSGSILIVRDILSMTGSL